jgi:hypothetical protein
MAGERFGKYEPKNFLPQRISKGFFEIADPDGALANPRLNLDVWNIIGPNSLKVLPFNYDFEARKIASIYLFPHLIKGAADSDAATRRFHLMPLPGAEGNLMLHPVNVFKKLSLLLSPRPERDSKYVEDDETIRQRLELFNYLRPVFNALLSNPDLKNWVMPIGTTLQTDRPLAFFVADLLRDMIEYEFFPHGNRANEIPMGGREEKYELAKQLIEIQGQIGENALESDSSTLDLAVLNTGLILNYPIFEEERMDLIKLGIPVLTKILGNPQLGQSNYSAQNILGEFTTMMNPSALRYSHWNLDREKRFTIAELVLKGLTESLKTGKFNSSDIEQILKTVESVNFCSEFSDDQKRELLVLTLPLLDSIAGSEAVKNSQVVRKLFLLLDFTLDKPGIKSFEVIAEGLKKEARIAFQEVLKSKVDVVTALKSSNLGEARDLLDYAETVVNMSKNPSLPEIPRLILTMLPEDSRRQKILPAVLKIIKTLIENNNLSENRIVKDLLPITKFLYSWYSNHTYEVAPEESL